MANWTDRLPYGRGAGRGRERGRHVHLVDAIAARDVAAATDLIHRHLSRTASRLARAGSR
jgi:DNA-binding GntR family transcriptional regulator